MATKIPESTLRLIDAALDLQQAGALDQAISVLEQAGKAAANYAPLHLILGLAYRDHGRFLEAEASLRRAIKLDPQQTDALQSLGLLLLTQQREQEAADYLGQHAAAIPNDAITLKALASALHKLERTDEAVVTLANAWQKTQEPTVGITYGRFLIRIQRWSEAEQVLAEVAKQNPTPNCLIEWAYAVILGKDYEKALEILRQIVELDSEYDRAWRGLTDTYLPLGRNEDALQAAERAITLNPKHCRNWLALANALLALERPAEATQAAQRGAELTPVDDPESLPVLHELHLRQVHGLIMTGNEDTAVARLAEWTTRYSTENRYVQLLISLLNAQGRPEEAWRYLQERNERWLIPTKFETLHRLGRPEEAWTIVVPTVNPEDEARLRQLANIGYELYGEQNIVGARAIFSQLHNYAPHIARFASSLAFILTGEGQQELDQAHKLLLAAQEMDDADIMEGVIEANLGYLLLLQGRYREAEEMFLTTLAVDPEETAVLRLATWQHDHLTPDPIPHPLRSIPVALAGQVNLVALKLAQGKDSEALALAQMAVQTFPPLTWGYWALGWTSVAQGDASTARQAWETAIQNSDNPLDSIVIKQWLSKLHL